MTHLERDGAPSIIHESGPVPGERAVWCGAALEYARPFPGLWRRRVTNTTTDPRHADCPECWAAVRRAREVEP